MPSERLHPRRGQVKLIVLVAIFVVAVAAAIWLWTRPGSKPDADAGRAVAETFLGDLREGRAPQAWDSTTAEFKSAQGKESFARSVRPLKFLKEPLDFVSVQEVAVGDQARSEFLFRAKTGETVRIVLGREDDQWKVDRWMK